MYQHQPTFSDWASLVSTCRHPPIVVWGLGAGGSRCVSPCFFLGVPVSHVATCRVRPSARLLPVHVPRVHIHTLASTFTPPHSFACTSRPRALYWTLRTFRGSRFPRARAVL